jgi:chromosome segregation ATPase
MNGRREHMRDQALDTASTDSRDLNYLGAAAASSRYEVSEALDLVSRTAEAIRDLQDRLAESEARAKASAASAIEKLQHAYARAHSAEVERGLALEKLAKLSERLEEAERELTRTQTRITAAETQLANAKQHIGVAQARAIEAEKAVTLIENAIRTQLIGIQRNPTRGLARAA